MAITKGSKHRRVSDALMRGLTSKKSGIAIDDLFVDVKPLKQEAEPKKIEFEFKTGCKYVIRDTGNIKAAQNLDNILIYQCRQGKHHFFKHWKAGWTITFTDPQLIGKIIQEVNT